MPMRAAVDRRAGGWTCSQTAPGPVGAREVAAA